MTGILNVLKIEGITGDVVVPSENWKDHGLVPVKVTVRFVDEPVQIDVVPVIVAVGLGVMVMLIAEGELTQPVTELRTVSVPL